MESKKSQKDSSAHKLKASNHVNYQSQIMNQNHLDMSQSLSAKASQPKKSFHHKNSTLPNAAVLLLNELMQANEDNSDIAQEDCYVEPKAAQSMG
jgi:hypothetical protein